MNMPDDISPRALADALRAFAYVIASTAPPDRAQALATSLDAVSTWPNLHPASAQLLRVLAEDASGFAKGQPRSPVL